MHLARTGQAIVVAGGGAAQHNYTPGKILSFDYYAIAIISEYKSR